MLNSDQILPKKITGFFLDTNSTYFNASIDALKKCLIQTPPEKLFTLITDLYESWNKKVSRNNLITTSLNVSLNNYMTCLFFTVYFSASAKVDVSSCLSFLNFLSQKLIESREKFLSISVDTREIDLYLQKMAAIFYLYYSKCCENNSTSSQSCFSVLYRDISEKIIEKIKPDSSYWNYMTGAYTKLISDNKNFPSIVLEDCEKMLAYCQRMDKENSTDFTSSFDTATDHTHQLEKKSFSRQRKAYTSKLKNSDQESQFLLSKSGIFNDTTSETDYKENCDNLISSH